MKGKVLMRIWVFFFLPHNRVFVDDEDVQKVKGGKAYMTYGISPEGAVLVIRPDGYVGMVAPLEGAAELDAYFAGFMKPGISS